MLASQRQSVQGSVVTDTVGSSSRYVDAAQGFRGLVVGVWGNGIFLAGQRSRELNPVSRAPDAYLSRDNLGIDLFYVITSIMRNYVYLPHRGC